MLVWTASASAAERVWRNARGHMSEFLAMDGYGVYIWPVFSRFPLPHSLVWPPRSGVVAARSGEGLRSLNPQDRKAARERRSRHGCDGGQRRGDSPGRAPCCRGRQLCDRRRRRTDPPRGERRRQDNAIADAWRPSSSRRQDQSAVVRPARRCAAETGSNAARIAATRTGVKAALTGARTPAFLVAPLRARGRQLARGRSGVRYRSACLIDAPGCFPQVSADALASRG